MLFLYLNKKTKDLSGGLEARLTDKEWLYESSERVVPMVVVCTYSLVTMRMMYSGNPWLVPVSLLFLHKVTLEVTKGKVSYHTHRTRCSWGRKATHCLLSFQCCSPYFVSSLLPF